MQHDRLMNHNISILVESILELISKSALNLSLTLYSPQQSVLKQFKELVSRQVYVSLESKIEVQEMQKEEDR